MKTFRENIWNDGEYTGGCIAGARRYLHINAGGDLEPCAFIHYSDANVREKSLLECYQSKFFKSYRANQPFNENMLRPCPLLDNPGKLSQMVHETGAVSTDHTHPEDVDELEAKSVLVIENSDQTIAQTVIQNTKTKDQTILVMDSLQSTTAAEVAEGKTYLDTMANNLSVLTEALA